jgi:hypothetical protein
MKKQRSWDEVTLAEAGRWLGKVLNEGQMAPNMISMHCPPWYV